MAELTTNVNWLAVIVGAAAGFLLGWLWYGPFFGKRWAAGTGRTWNGGMKPSAAALGAQALATLLLAWLFGITAAANAPATIVLVVIAICAFVASAGLWGGKRRDAIAIETGYVIAMAVLMFAAQAVF